MPKNKTLLVMLSLVTLLLFVQSVFLAALLTTACGMSIPGYRSVACSVLGPANTASSAPSISQSEAEALVRHNIVSSLHPAFAQRAIASSYTSRYDGKGKWNVSTPVGEWIVLEGHGVSFPVTTSITSTMMLAPWVIERRLSSIESDISSMQNDTSSMQNDISSMERDISSMGSDISDLNYLGVMIRR